MATSASVREFDVPAQMETLSYQFMVSEAKTDRRAVLCETNATPAKITEIQRALHQAKGLPVDGFLNLDTVKSLGVSPN